MVWGHGPWIRLCVCILLSVCLSQTQTTVTYVGEVSQVTTAKRYDYVRTPADAVFSLCKVI